MKIYKIFQKLFKPKKCQWLHGVIVCPRCGAIAFTENETPKWMTKGYCFRCGKYLFWDTTINQCRKESIVMVDNKTFRDIAWLLAKLYIATDNLGECADNIPEFKTLCKRYGVEFWGTFSAEELVLNGIDKLTKPKFSRWESKMSHADYLEDGADYYAIYGGDDCDGECDKCPCVDCDEHPEYKRKQRAIRLQNQIRHHEF